ncbi:hypothetical protein D3C75_1290400 [compost metagenome]
MLLAVAPGRDGNAAVQVGRHLDNGKKRFILRLHSLLGEHHSQIQGLGMHQRERAGLIHRHRGKHGINDFVEILVHRFFVGQVQAFIIA